MLRKQIATCFRNAKNLKNLQIHSKSLNLSYQSCQGLHHIKNMVDENLKYRVEQIYEKGELVEKTDRVYKPSYTIEFNREGEVLLFSCNPIKNAIIYFKYPYVFYESLIPNCLWMYWFNPMEIEWYWNNVFLLLSCTLWIPRIWYYRSFNYKVKKLSLLRGGKVLRVETQSLAGDRYINWVENYQSHPLTEDCREFADRDNADFLEVEGQLKYDLGVEMEHFTEFGVNQQNIVLYFMQNGIVHHPEIFEAALKGYNIDTSNYVINTANNIRSLEGSHNF